MKIQLQLILSACIVYFGLTSVQPRDQTADKPVTGKVNDESKIQKNFQNLFHSIARNDTNKREIYHEILKGEVTKEQRAFDTMREELQSAKYRNVYKKMNFYKKSYDSENIVATKRETKTKKKKSGAGASRELPGDNDEFEDLRTKNKIYIDKTSYITKLLEQNERFISVCRPRRFGKSNFLQMLKSFFLGNRTLFEGLDIYAKHNWTSHPVIYLDFNTMDVRTVEDFKTDLAKLLRQIGESYGHTLSATESINTLLDELMFALSGQGESFESVVILINEYDWPVRRNADTDNKVEVWEISNFLREFFMEIKTFAEKVKMLVLTCTTPLQLRNFRGGLDFLKDITYDPEFSQMIGLTETELKDNFKSHIKSLARQPKETFDSIVQTLRKRYNGYCFSKKTDPSCRVYNFQSAISALRNKNITNYWHANSDPNYNMVNEYQKEEYRRHVGTLDFFTNYTIARSAVQTRMDFNNPISMIMFMVVYGYLTFRGYKEDTDEFILDFPNEEVREKFIKEVLEPVPLGTLPVSEVFDKCETLRRSMFEGGKCEQFVENLNQMAFDPEANVESEDVERVDYDEEGGANEKVTERNYPDHIIRVFQICNIKNHCSFALFHRDFSLACTIGLVAEGTKSTEQYVFEFGPVETSMKKLLNFAKMPEFQKKFYDQKLYLMGIDFSEEGGTINDWIRVTLEFGRYKDLQASDVAFTKLFKNVTESKPTTTEAVLGLMNTFY